LTPGEKKLRYSLFRRLGGPQIWSVRCEEKHVYFCKESISDSQVVQSVVGELLYYPKIYLCTTIIPLDLKVRKNELIAFKIVAYAVITSITY
jgi:hypothetical protein